MALGKLRSLFTQLKKDVGPQATKQLMDALPSKPADLEAKGVDLVCAKVFEGLQSDLDSFGQTHADAMYIMEEEDKVMEKLLLVFKTTKTADGSEVMTYGFYLYIKHVRKCS